MAVSKTIWTIGHSTRSMEDFMQLLQQYQIEAIADIRKFPGSRKYPQFNKEALSESLQKAGIHYEHIEELGGRRKPDKDSENTRWRHPAFRAYADYMETKEFSQGIEKLLALRQKYRTAYMCSEAVWWRCHRALVSDYLKFKGYMVIHILSGSKTEEHPYTSAAAFKDGQLTYKPADLFSS